MAIERDWVDYLNGAAGIATSVGVIYAIWQGREAREESAEVKKRALRAEERQAIAEQMDFALASPNYIQILGTISNAAERAEFSAYETIAILAPVLIARGRTPGGGSVDRSNCHEVATRLLHFGEKSANGS